MTREALAEGRTAQEVLTEGLIAGMSVVGRTSAQHPVRAGGADRGAGDEGRMGVEAAAGRQGVGAKSAGVLLMGTVRGDLHDIGKNLVCMMAEAQGSKSTTSAWTRASRSSRATEQFKPDIVGMSALLTTTRPT